MRVEAEPVVPLLDPGVKRPIVAPEADAEKVLFLSRVPEEESAVWSVLQEPFRLVPIHLAPVEGALGDIQKVWHEAMEVVHLGVGLTKELGPVSVHFHLNGRGIVRRNSIRVPRGESEHSLQKRKRQNFSLE